ncbi:MAG: selenocysteine-specific translation elongation factor [Desulfobacterales bacterium]|nr:selenocysteine-specific translation elongation factor [Desulfobacterales bacterium]
MKQIILGTAGHIDHGKTTLIKAVTGVNTDRLEEEQRRGITIVLGFADMTLPSGLHVGIVDVPGHEKFVKTMVAGATGIDLVAMVIAADEGIMPQTREHMEICSLLGIKHGVVVLTKVDMVDEEWLEMVTEDIRSFMEETFLEDAPIIPVSGVTGQGVPELINTLDEVCQTITPRSSSGLFRIPVDRVFTMKGFGTVITGSLASGKISVGDIIRIYPSEITSKVRGIQSHGKMVETAEAGMRTAINFQGIEKELVNRGDVLAYPDTLTTSYMLDVSFRYLKGNKKPLKNRTRVRFHAGSSSIMCNLILLDRDELLPGETVAVQLRLDRPVTLVKDDPFVIRSYSPVMTIGGGRILNPVPQKHKRYQGDIVNELNAMADGSPEEIVDYQVRAVGFKGVSFASLKIMTNLQDKKLDIILQGMLSKKDATLVDKENRIFIHHQSLELLQNKISEFLVQFHKKNPLKEGVSKEEIKSHLPPVINIKLFTLLISQMEKEKLIRQDADLVALTGHKVSLGVDQEEVKKLILETLIKNDLTPPYFRDICKTINIDSKRGKDVLNLLIKEGKVIKIKDELYFFKEAINALQEKLIGFLKNNGELTTPQFKDMTGVSRKYLIPLIEYFDDQRVTIRVGEVRQLRGA